MVLKILGNIIDLFVFFSEKNRFFYKISVQNRFLTLNIIVILVFLMISIDFYITLFNQNVIHESKLLKRIKIIKVCENIRIGGSKTEFLIKFSFLMIHIDFYSVLIEMRNLKINS